ncbi:protein HIRA-like isoform X2 [Anneissia japonica]|uniref:protein HIRA-like isoform X2 n=1 Tax=Anneissia japonica TaxID=1529436 RepID=UPI0014259371|nr:protein HIRA-like isoform X2 [Anneissia japonica]
MRLLKPTWVNHDGKPIFAIDIHPDGSRFATGGQGDDSGRVVIWNMAPVAKEDDEKNENVPRMLCEMDNHLACVNCVRWSNNGLYLASAGDDRLVMIWQLMSYGGMSTPFGKSKANIERWRCTSTLRQHAGDILDIAWSPHDAWLASCSVDNTVVIWNAVKFPEVLTILTGHSGMVKGVTWDPIGKYLASQSDDKSIRVWRTMDWKEENKISKPFEECGGTTHVLRCSWSPDGHYIVSAHAMNNRGPTAQIIERDGWKFKMDFVGHRKAVTCVRFNSNIFSKIIKKGSSKAQQFSCCAIGSRDRAVSVWLTALKRPLVVIHDLFKNSVMDLAWSKSGTQLLACSWDGTVAFFDFDQDEIGHQLNQEEKNKLYEKIYGKNLGVANTVIENPDMLNLLKMQKEQQEKLAAKVQASPLSTPKKVIAPIMDKPPTDVKSKQIETRTPDGRRRITPLYIAPQVNVGAPMVPFTNVPHPAFSPANQVTPIKSAFKEPSKLSIKTEKQESDSDSEDAKPLSALQANIQPMAALDSRFTEKSKATSGSTAPEKTKVTPSPQSPSSVAAAAAAAACAAAAAAVAAAASDKNKEPSKIKETPKTTNTGSPSSLSGSKRKDEGSLKPGPKRPRKEYTKNVTEVKTGPRKGPMIGPPSTQEVTPKVVTTAPSSTSKPRLKLPVPKIEKTLSVQVSTGTDHQASVMLEVENDISSGKVTLHRLKYLKGGEDLWNNMLASRISAAAGNSHFCAVATENKAVSVYTIGGRRKSLPIILSEPISGLHCGGWYLLVILASARLFVWDIKKQVVVIKNETLTPIMPVSSVTVENVSITNAGAPIITLSNGKSFTFNTALCCWMMVHEKDNVLQSCSDHQTSVLAQAAVQIQGPLSSLQSKPNRFGASRVFQLSPQMQKSSTLSHLESQLNAALVLKSGKEYKFWLLTCVRYMVQEGVESRLREVCDEMLGPCYKADADTSSWESHVLGLNKRKLLEEILPIIGTNLKLQRLYSEYQDQLEMFKK